MAAALAETLTELVHCAQRTAITAAVSRVHIVHCAQRTAFTAAVSRSQVVHCSQRPAFTAAVSRVHVVHCAQRTAIMAAVSKVQVAEPSQRPAYKNAFSRLQVVPSEKWTEIGLFWQQCSLTKYDDGLRTSAAPAAAFHEAVLCALCPAWYGPLLHLPTACQLLQKLSSSCDLS